MEEPKRGKAKIKKHYITKDLYNYYKKNSKNPVSYKQYMEFLYGDTKKNEGFIRIYTNEIIYKSSVLKLPIGGTLSIRKHKPLVKFNNKGELDIKRSKMNIDWRATRKYWEDNPGSKENKVFIYFNNKHTRGYLYNYFWDKKRMGGIKNRFFYKFCPCRSLSRELAKILKENPNIEYYTR